METEEENNNVSEENLNSVQETSEIENTESEPATKLIALKGRFQSAKEQYYGIFLVMVNPELMHIDSASTVVSGYSDVYNISLLEKWTEIDQKIQKLRYEGQYAKAVTNDLQDNFKYIILDTDNINEFLNKIKNNEQQEIINFLKEKFQKSIHDEEMKIEISLENINEADLNQSDESEEESNDSEGTFINVNLVLAPVNGKLVTELKKGDVIMVRINADTEKSVNIIEQLQLKTEKGIKPAPAKILKTEPAQKGLRLLLGISTGIYSHILEEEKVLVRMYDPAKDNPDSEKPKQTNTEKTENQKQIPIKKKEKSIMPFIMTSVFVLIILILMLTYLIVS